MSKAKSSPNYKPNYSIEEASLEVQTGSQSQSQSQSQSLSQSNSQFHQNYQQMGTLFREDDDDIKDPSYVDASNEDDADTNDEDVKFLIPEKKTQSTPKKAYGRKTPKQRRKSKSPNRRKSRQKQKQPEPQQQEEWDFDEILDDRFESVKNRQEYLVKWTGSDSATGEPYEPTWEPEYNLPPDAIERYLKATKSNPKRRIIHDSESPEITPIRKGPRIQEDDDYIERHISDIMDISDDEIGPAPFATHVTNDISSPTPPPDFQLPPPLPPSRDPALASAGQSSSQQIKEKPKTRLSARVKPHDPTINPKQYQELRRSRTQRQSHQQESDNDVRSASFTSTNPYYSTRLLEDEDFPPPSTAPPAANISSLSHTSRHISEEDQSIISSSRGEHERRRPRSSFAQVYQSIIDLIQDKDFIGDDALKGMLINYIKNPDYIMSKLGSTLNSKDEWTFEVDRDEKFIHLLKLYPKDLDHTMRRHLLSDKNFPKIHDSLDIFGPDIYYAKPTDLERLSQNELARRLTQVLEHVNSLEQAKNDVDRGNTEVKQMKKEYQEMNNTLQLVQKCLKSSESKLKAAEQKFARSQSELFSAQEKLLHTESALKSTEEKLTVLSHERANENKSTSTNSKSTGTLTDPVPESSSSSSSDQQQFNQLLIAYKAMSSQVEKYKKDNSILSSANQELQNKVSQGLHQMKLMDSGFQNQYSQEFAKEIAKLQAEMAFLKERLKKVNSSEILSKAEMYDRIQEEKQIQAEKQRSAQAQSQAQAQAKTNEPGPGETIRCLWKEQDSICGSCHDKRDSLEYHLIFDHVAPEFR